MAPKSALKTKSPARKSPVSTPKALSSVAGKAIAKKQMSPALKPKPETTSPSATRSSSAAAKAKSGKKPAAEPVQEEDDDEEEEIEDVEIPDDEFEAVIAQDLYADDEDDEGTDDEALLAGVLGSDDEDEEEVPVSKKTGKNAAKSASIEEEDEEDDVEVDELALQNAIVQLQDTIANKKTLKEKRKEKKAAGVVTETKSASKVDEEKSKPGKKTGVVYLGRIPHGFYEKEMKSYFSQFGEVLKLRLSRNKKTGASKHYAFLEFPSQQVAQIVADTMHGYLLFNQILQCQVVPLDKLHPDTFKGHDRRFKVLPWNKIERQRVNKPLNAEDVLKRTTKLVARENRKRMRLAEAGIDYQFGGYAEAVKRVKGEEPAAHGKKAGSKPASVATTPMKAAKVTKEAVSPAPAPVADAVAKTPAKAAKAVSAAPVSAHKATPVSVAAVTPKKPESGKKAVTRSATPAPATPAPAPAATVGKSAKKSPAPKTPAPAPKTPAPTAAASTPAAAKASAKKSPASVGKKAGAKRV